MKKIPTLFRRNPDDMRHVLPEVTPGCEWVLAGEGLPTRKYDGTCVALFPQSYAGELAFPWVARREVKPGKQSPPNFMPVETDEVTGKTVGWEPIEQSPFAKFHAEALAAHIGDPPPGTYELIGRKINGNPEHQATHALIRHADAAPVHAPFPGGSAAGAFTALAEALTGPLFEHIEGVVWHHPDGRMAKLKRRDFPKDPCALIGSAGDPCGAVEEAA